jgi:hypothetical protein
MFQNNPFFSLLIKIFIFFYKKSDGFYTNSNNLNKHKIKRIIFLLDDEKYFHLGDILFFLPPILYLLDLDKFNIKIFIHKHHSGLINNFKFNKKIFYTKKYLYKNNDVIISNPYMYKNLYKKRKTLLFGNYWNKIKIPYPKHLTMQICKSLNLKFNEKKYKKNIYKLKINLKNHKNYFLDKKTKYFFLTPYLGSGKFRDIFNFKQKKIINFSKKLIKKGFKPVLVGSKHDDNLNINYKIINLKGLSLKKIIKISFSKNIVCACGFDNFWMHFFDIMGKKYYTLFRGKLSKTNTYNHLNSINVSFNKKKNYIN